MLQVYYNSNLEDKVYNLKHHHFLLYLDKYLLDIKIQFRIKFQLDNKNLKDSLKMLMYLTDHSIFLQDMQYMMFDQSMVNTIQNHKGFEPLYLQDNNILLHKYKRLVNFHLLLLDNSIQVHNFQFLGSQVQQFNNTTLHHK